MSVRQAAGAGEEEYGTQHRHDITSKILPPKLGAIFYVTEVSIQDAWDRWRWWCM